MASIYTDLELLPATGEELSPEEEIAAAYYDPDAPAVGEPGALPVGNNLNYDLDTGQFGRKLGGVQAVVQVLKIAMFTPRGQYPGMFPSTFGMEDPERLIGKVVTEELRAAHARDVETTLLQAHDRVTDVFDISYEYHPDDTVAFMSVAVQLDGGETIEMRI